MEGMLSGGKLTVLAIFDKPDPLDGPYFEETIYVAPSRLHPEIIAEIHRVVQAVLDLPEPAYHHHRLLLDDEGKRFAKRNKSVTLRALRDQGKTAADILRMVGLG